MSSRFSSKLEKYRKEHDKFPSTAGTPEPKERDRPPTPGREHEWMGGESYTDTMADITEINEGGVEEPEDDVVSWGGEVGYTGYLWRQWLSEEDPKKGGELEMLAKKLSVRSKSRIEKLVWERLMSETDFIIQSVEDEDKQTQQGILAMARRTGTRTRKKREGSRARHAEEAKQESLGLSKSQKRTRREAPAKLRHPKGTSCSSVSISKLRK